MSLEVVTAVSGLTGVFSVMIFLQIMVHVSSSIAISIKKGRKAKAEKE